MYGFSVREQHRKTPLLPINAPSTISEAYWVFFRFVYVGQFVDPCLIIVCDEFLGGGVAEGFMESGIVPSVDQVQGGPFDLGA